MEPIQPATADQIAIYIGRENFWNGKVWEYNTIFGITVCRLIGGLMVF